MKNYKTLDELQATWAAAEKHEQAERATVIGAIKYFFIDCYYGVRRAFGWIEDRPRRIKWFFQRGKRGYSDFDVWGFHQYLAEVITGGLKKLKTYKSGYPAMIMKDEDYGKDFGPTDDRDKMYRQKWEDILSKMIYAFEMLHNENGDGPQVILNYEELTRSQLASIKRIEKTNKKRHYTTKEESARVKEGMELFCKYFQTLWD